ncbi:hypothetical protein J3459_009820 [Metarhizium acridum]|nr:hypothetical protein J3459_009820 [Metarhizium acridum]
MFIEVLNPFKTQLVVCKILFALGELQLALKGEMDRFIREPYYSAGERKMVRQSDHQDEEADRHMPERAATRRYDAMERAFEAAAKAARKRRREGALETLYIVGSNGGGRHASA